eukprot:5803-Heterococcus_DN1.PRE.2
MLYTPLVRCFRHFGEWACTAVKGSKRWCVGIAVEFALYCVTSFEWLTVWSLCLGFVAAAAAAAVVYCCCS